MSPGLLTLAFLHGEALVRVLQVFVSLHAFLGILVLKHASHACDGISLGSVGCVFTTLLITLLVHLTALLVSPVLQVSGVESHSVVVH